MNSRGENLTLTVEREDTDAAVRACHLEGTYVVLVDMKWVLLSWFRHEKGWFSGYQLLTVRLLTVESWYV